MLTSVIEPLFVNYQTTVNPTNNSETDVVLKYHFVIQTSAININYVIVL